MTKKILLRVTVFCFLLVFILSAVLVFGEIVVVSPLHQQFKGTPGKTYAASIKVYNQGEKEITVLVYKADFLQNGRELRVSEPGKKLNQRSNADWIKLEKNRLLLGPKEYQEIGINLRLPKKKLTGDFVSMVFVQEDEASSLANKTGMKIVTRIATIFETQFSQGLSDIEILEVKSGKNGHLQILIKNTGETSLPISLDLNLEGEYFPASKPKKVFPGGIEAFDFVTTLGIGEYQGTFLIQAGKKVYSGKRQILVGERGPVKKELSPLF